MNTLDHFESIQLVLSSNLVESLQDFFTDFRVGDQTLQCLNVGGGHALAESLLDEARGVNGIKHRDCHEGRASRVGVD